MFLLTRPFPTARALPTFPTNEHWQFACRRSPIVAEASPQILGSSHTKSYATMAWTVGRSSLLRHCGILAQGSKTASLGSVERRRDIPLVWRMRQAICP